LYSEISQVSNHKIEAQRFIFIPTKEAPARRHHSYRCASSDFSLGHTATRQYMVGAAKIRNNSVTSKKKSKKLQEHVLEMPSPLTQITRNAFVERDL
jgi:hypothetical protein